MSETKECAEETDQMKAQQEMQERAEAEFKKLIESPLTKEEADKMLADNDVQVAQLRVLRIRKTEELNQIDHQLEMAGLDRSIVVRRLLNSTETAAE